MTELVFLGDSHVATITLAYRKHYMPSPPAGVTHAEFIMLGAATDLYAPFFTMDEQQIRFTAPNILQNLGRKNQSVVLPAPSNDRLYMVSGGMHTQSLLLGRTWVTHAPWNSSPAAERCAMSSGVFQAIVENTNQHVFRFVDTLANLGNRVFIISAPPPSRRFALLELGYDENDLVAIDAAARDVAIQRYRSLGHEVILPPSEVMEEGILKDKFLVDDKSDRHHGNIEYSRLFLAKILRTLEVRSKEPARAGGITSGQPPLGGVLKVERRRSDG